VFISVSFFFLFCSLSASVRFLLFFFLFFSFFFLLLVSGVWRSLVIRHSERTQQTMVVVVVNTANCPGGNEGDAWGEEKKRLTAAFFGQELCTSLHVQVGAVLHVLKEEAGQERFSF
jgi:hypothetical protein